MNRKFVLFGGLLAFAMGAFAFPHHPGPHHPGPWHPGPMPMHYHRHCDFWGPGGRNFWPGFIGGVVGGAIVSSAVPVRETVVVSQPTVATPVVVQQPVVVQPTPTVVVQQPATTVQNVWVEGCYVDQVQANGSVIRTWQPGHYEQRSVTIR